MVFGSPKVRRILMDTENYSYMCVCVLVCFENYIYVFRCTRIYNMFSFLFIHAKIDIGMYFGSYKKSFVQYIYIHLIQTLKWGSYTSFTFNMCGVRDAKGWEAPIYIFLFFIYLFIYLFIYSFIYLFLNYLFIFLIIFLFIYLFIFLHLCKTKCILFFVPSFLITICILGELHLFTYIFKYIHNIHIYVFHLCFTICILGEMYIQILIYDKNPKVHRGGGVFFFWRYSTVY